MFNNIYKNSTKISLMLIPTSGSNQLIKGKKNINTEVVSKKLDKKYSMYGKIAREIMKSGSLTFRNEKRILLIFCFDKKTIIKAIINTPAITQPRL